MEALQIYDQFANPQTTVCNLFAIKACTKLGDIWKGKEIHNRIGDKNIDLQLANTLIHFYGQFNQIKLALNVFNGIKNKDGVSYNSMVKRILNLVYAESIRFIRSKCEG